MLIFMADLSIQQGLGHIFKKSGLLLTCTLEAPRRRRKSPWEKDSVTNLRTEEHAQEAATAGTCTKQTVRNYYVYWVQILGSYLSSYQGSLSFRKMLRKIPLYMIYSKQSNFLTKVVVPRSEKRIILICPHTFLSFLQ